MVKQGTSLEVIDALFFVEGVEIAHIVWRDGDHVRYVRDILLVAVDALKRLFATDSLLFADPLRLSSLDLLALLGEIGCRS